MRDTCDLCENESRYVPEYNGTKRNLCYRHYAEDYREVVLVFHRYVPQWVKDRMLSQELQKKICQYWVGHMPHVVVHFFHRNEVETLAWKNIWEIGDQNKYYGHEFKVSAIRKPYGYRGQCAAWKNEIFVFVDEHETPASVEWIFWHEMGHLAVSTVPLIDKVFDIEDKIAGRTSYDWEDDEKHDAHAEEVFVGRIGTAIGGGEDDQTVYDRSWWRPRVVKGIVYTPTPSEPAAPVAAEDSDQTTQGA